MRCVMMQRLSENARGKALPTECDSEGVRCAVERTLWLPNKRMKLTRRGWSWSEARFTAGARSVVIEWGGSRSRASQLIRGVLRT